MKLLLVRCFIFLSICLIQIGCIPVPAKVEKRITDPGKNYYEKGYSRGYNINYAKEQLEILSNESASRADVIEKLGVPLHYTSNSISYEACQGEHGAGVILFSYPLGASVVPINTEQGECYEVIIDFDADDRLDAYEAIPYADSPTIYNKCDEEQAYRYLASQGDSVARSLWEETDTFRAQQLKSLAENGNPISQFQYFQLTHYPGNCSSTEAHKNFRMERLRYICRAADQKYAPAMLELAKAYRKGGTWGIPRDIKQAYVWYSLAEGALYKDWNVWQLDVIRKEISTGELSEAENMLKAWMPGQCEQHLAGKDMSERMRNVCHKAELGHTYAQLELARFYWQRADISANRCKSYMWYMLAATGYINNGLYSEGRLQERAKIEVNYKKEKILTEEQLIKASQMLSTWKSGQCVQSLVEDGIIDRAPADGNQK